MEVGGEGDYIPIAIEVLPLTNLTPYRNAKPAHDLVDIQKRAIKTSHSCRFTCERSESAQESGE